jgi:hypothetical protein
MQGKFIAPNTAATNAMATYVVMGSPKDERA